MRVESPPEMNTPHCPLLGGCKCVETIGIGNIWNLKQCFLLRGLLYTVPISEGPLLETLQYTHIAIKL